MILDEQVKLVPFKAGFKNNERNFLRKGRRWTKAKALNKTGESVASVPFKQRRV